MGNFCTGCGNKLYGKDKFCTECGKFSGNDPEGKILEYPYTGGVTPAKPKKKMLLQVITVIAGILLIFLGVQSMVLNIFGRNTNAVIVRATQSTSADDSGFTDSRLFDIQYEFFVDGEKYTGSSTKLFEYGLRTDIPVTVRYLPQRPRINALIEDTGGFTGIFFIVLGGVIIIFGIKANIKFIKKD